MTSISGHSMRRSKRRAGLVGISALVLALTGAAPGAWASGSGTSEAEITADGGGRATARRRIEADQRLDPVKVGLIEQVQGGIVTPEYGAAVDAMVAYFNAERGGAGGHPIVIERCTTDDTVASARACAEQLAAASDVHLVIESTTNPSAIADVLGPAGKALLAGGVDMGNMLRPGVFVMEPGSAGIAQALFSYAATDLDVTHLTVFITDDPAITAFIPVLDHIASTTGLTIDAYVPVGSAGDLTGPISEGIAEESDGLAFVLAPHQCAPAGEALHALGIDLPVIAAELCLTDEIAGSGMIDGWHAGTQSIASVVNGRRETVKIRRILRHYGDGAERGGFAGLGIGYSWIARDVLEQAGAGAATDQSVMQALATYSSSDVLGYDEVSCPGPGSFISACNTSTLIVQVDGTRIRDVGGFVQSDFSIFEGLIGP